MTTSTPTLARTDAIRLELHDLDRRTATARSQAEHALRASQHLLADAELARTRAARAATRARCRYGAHQQRLALSSPATHAGARADVLPMRPGLAARTADAAELPFDAAA